jgi:hypothetical protein
MCIDLDMVTELGELGLVLGLGLGSELGLELLLEEELELGLGFDSCQIVEIACAST